MVALPQKIGIDSQNCKTLFYENGVFGPQNLVCGISPKLTDLRKKFNLDKFLLKLHIG